MTVAIVDVGMGNLRSVAKALDWVGCPARVTSSAEDIRRASGIVLPGQGAFRAFIEGLERNGVKEAVLEAIHQGKPYLGICLGLQVLFEQSEEHGPAAGLGVLKGRVCRFRPGSHEALKVPHMGWNQVEIRRECSLLDGVLSGDYFYFVHSYYVVPDDPEVVATVTEYGTSFVSSVSSGRLFACQFHPEKSQRIGMKLLQNFTRLVAQA
jgi:glutamine amidotransferase